MPAYTVCNLLFMARYDKLQVMTKMAASGMIPVFYHPCQETACQVIQACYDGGVRVFEFTNRGDFAHEVFAHCMQYVQEHCPDMALGVGSVVDSPTAALYIQMGACFVVGPLLNADVARLCNRRQIPYIPGCGSVSEIGTAQELGCEITKVFPGDVYGPAFVKGMMAPCPWSRIMVTGGVAPEEENLRGWFQAGAFCVGIGSKLFPKGSVEKQDWDAISTRCREVLSCIARIRG